MRYRRIELLSPSEDRTIAELYAAGCLGIEQPLTAEETARLHAVDSQAVSDLETQAGSQQRDGRLVAYFADNDDCPSTEQLATWGCTTLSEQVLEEQDWLQQYRLCVEPVMVGQQFMLDASEPEEDGARQTRAASTDRHVLRLPARQAFGTGSHETTQLMIEGLESIDLASKRVLDVGVGTGVLSFVATLLGAASVVGFDLDPKAPAAARENARLNKMKVPLLFVGTASAVATGPLFDVLLVNVLEDRIESDVERLCAVVAPGGVALVSGVLVERSKEVAAHWACFGLEVVESSQRGEWLLLFLRRGRSKNDPGRP